MVRQAHHKTIAGFSMVELLLTVVFVTLGSLMVQGTFMKAADMFGRYSNTLRAMVWAERTIASAREALQRDEYSDSEEGTLRLSGKDFHWKRQSSSKSGPNLFSIRVSLSWTESGKPLTYEKELYVYKRDLSLQL